MNRNDILGIFALLRLMAAIVLALATLEAQGQQRAKANEPKPSKSADPSESFFSKGSVPHLKVEITGTNLTALLRNDRAYVRAIVHDRDRIYTNVGIHVKGAAGSRRELNDRPALTLNFDKFEAHQRFHGLDKIHLNNSVQDPSYMTELLCGELFRAAGVPAARTTHARVELNGRDLGLYVLKEGFNKTFLRRYFKNANGNLFDGGFLRDISEPLERICGSETNVYGALKAVVAAAQEPDPAQRLERMEKVLDLDRFISMIAMEIMVWHWDGYAMKKNNYKVYHDPASDKVVFFPHGMDQMFWEAEGTILPSNRDGLVADYLLQTTAGRRRYRERMANLLTNVFRVEVLTNRINEVQARIRPVLAAMSADSARSHDEVVNNLRQQIVTRASSIARQLATAEPMPVVFNVSGKAPLEVWRQQNQFGSALLDRTVESTNQQTLHIRANQNGNCIASWRSKVLLEAGQYRFEGRVRAAGVASLNDQKGEGAGLRISGSRTPRSNKATGNSPWQKLAYDFTVALPSQEVDLVCELRAVKGEAWFDLESLQLVRKRND